jgi:hypothetical protein
MQITGNGIHIAYARLTAQLLRPLSGPVVLHNLVHAGLLDSPNREKERYLK